MKTTVTACIFHENKVLVVFHKRLGQWMHVGGHVEEDEFFDHALKRECLEEVNLDIQLVNPLSEISSLVENRPYGLTLPIMLTGGLSKNDESKTLSIDYLAVALNPSEVKLQESELSAYKWIAESEIDALDTFDSLKDLLKVSFRLIKRCC